MMQVLCVVVDAPDRGFTCKDGKILLQRSVDVLDDIAPPLVACVLFRSTGGMLRQLHNRGILFVPGRGLQQA